jgi:hypothetical protein
VAASGVALRPEVPRTGLSMGRAQTMAMGRGPRLLLADARETEEECTRKSVHDVFAIGGGEATLVVLAA